MFELAYSFFFVVLLLEVVVFLFLNLPTPHGWKAVIIKFLNTNKHVKSVMRLHLGCCLLAGFFYYDCYRQEAKYSLDKAEVRGRDSYAAQLKYNYLSFMTLKVQRNKYILFMLIYASLALNAYIWLLNYMYRKREHHEKTLQEQGRQHQNEQKEPAKN